MSCALLRPYQGGVPGRATGFIMATVCLLLILAPGSVASGSSSADLPAAPQLLLPAMRASGVATSPAFVWHASEGALTYHLQVSTWPDFSRMVIDEPSVDDTTYIPPFLLADGTMYFWRVRAQNLAGATPWVPALSGWVFTTETDGLPPPTPVTPPIEAIDVPLTATFAWDPVEGAEGYDLQIAASVDFSSIVYDQPGIAGTVHTLPVPLPPGVLLFWRVRSVNAQGSSLWSPAVAGWPFQTVATLIGRPVQTAPPAGATGMTVTPTLAWEPVAGAESYTVQVSTHSMIADAEMTWTGITSTSFTPPVPLANLTTYFWRVSAVGGGEAGMFSSPFTGRTFMTMGAGVSAPELLLPADGAAGVPKTPVLVWRTVPGAVGYDVQVTAEQFLGGTSFTIPAVGDTMLMLPPGALVGGMQYFWKVRALTPAGNSSWSPATGGRSFTTAYDPPAVPLLFIPPDGSVNVPRHCVLSWWNNTDSVATLFDVQVAATPDFSAPVVDLQGVAGTEITAFLPGLSTFHWRVRATNPAGPSAWSTVWAFSTNDVALAPPVLVSPADGTKRQPLQPTFTWRASPGATSYQLQVSTTESFVMEWLLPVNASDIDGTTYRPSEPLRKTTLYRWRVRCMNGTDTSLWSPMFASRTFTTMPPIPPSPVLVAPAYGDTTVPLKPTFVWREAPGAESYGIEISADEYFGVVVHAECGIEGTTYDLPVMLSGSTSYYWRVNARNGGGAGPFSPSWPFTTIPAAPEPPVITRQPATQHVVIGQTATFVTGAAGTGPLSYQWERNGVALPGATASAHTTPVAETGDDGAVYRCTVSNAVGSITTADAVIMLTTEPASVVRNGTFDAGTAPWEFHTDGVGSFAADMPGNGSPAAAHVAIAGEGVNVQLYQAGIMLEPFTAYRLTFSVRSTSGNDLDVTLQKNTCPYTLYGLDGEFVDVREGWTTHTIIFRTTGFMLPVEDARLSFVLGTFDRADEDYLIDDVTLVKHVASDDVVSMLGNAGFEAGIRPWSFHTDGAGAFDADAAGPESRHAARVTIDEPGENVQLFQSGITLEPRTVYRLTFRGYSSTGHDVMLALHRHEGSYESYGLRDRHIDLGTAWETHTVLFVTPDREAPLTDGRFRFWMAPFDAAGDVYWFDDVVLERVDLGNDPIVASSVLGNPGFEDGSGPWWFYTNGSGSYSADGTGPSTPHAARVAITGTGDNTQLSQTFPMLSPGTVYRLAFVARSTAGRDCGVGIHQDTPPYTGMGTGMETCDLKATWQPFSIVFRTPEAVDPAAAVRLQFAFGPFAEPGDEYLIDDVVLVPLDGVLPAGSGSGSVAAGEDPTAPADFVVHPNFPNPFNPSTTIVFGLPEASDVTLSVFNVLGQEVVRLAEGTRPAGYSSVVWDTRNGQGLQLGSGLYFYRFTARGASGRTETVVRSMMLLR